MATHEGWRNSWEFGDPIVTGGMLRGEQHGPPGRLLESQIDPTSFWISADIMEKVMKENTPSDPLVNPIVVDMNTQAGRVTLDEWYAAMAKAGRVKSLEELTRPSREARANRIADAELIENNPCSVIMCREPMGYHLMQNMPKGEFGTLDKVVEEGYEIYDAMAQGSPIMMFVEFADLCGAIRGYAEAQGFDLDRELTRYEAIANGTVGEIVTDAITIRECLTRDNELRRFARILMNIQAVVMGYGMSMEHVWLMERATARAFRNGVRHDRRGQEVGRPAAGDG
jgi:hypothetical protein